jgi:DNA modification methylase
MMRHNVRLDRIEYLPTDHLKLYGRQLRKRKAIYLEAMRTSVSTFGIVLPLLIDQHNTVIAGEGVLEAAKSLGITEVPIVRVEHLHEEQVRLLRLALNKMSDHSDWNQIELKAEFGELMQIEMDIALDVSGFSNPEIDALVFAPVEDESQVEPGDDPVAIGAAGSAVSRLGDHWDLGDHGVLCGSSLELANLREVMDGLLAKMVLSDAPYNVKISGNVSGLGKNAHREFAQASGEMSEAEFIAFLTSSIKAMAACCADGSLLYLYMDWRHIWEMMSALRANDLTLINLAVWAKRSSGMGSLYRSQHELVFIARKGAVQHKNNVQLGRFGRNRSNLWSYPGVNGFGADRDALLAMHPTCKTVSMLADAIRDVTDRGDIVLDGFLGSGSTLIAAQRTDRICRGMEIDPLYVDAIIQRWEAATGKVATLRGTGETMAEVAARRAQEPVAIARPDITARPRTRASA